jgi:hypothetical protein
LFLFAIAAAMTVGYLSIEPFNPEQPAAGEDPQQASSSQLTVNQRLGYATLLSSGYAAVGPGEVVVEDTPSGDTQRVVTPPPYPVRLTSDAVLKCIPHLRVDARVSFERLVVAILAAESFNRGEVYRSLEFAFARTWRLFSGEVPDLTFGIAQVRFSKAKEILQSLISRSLPDREVLSILEEPCDNVAIASRYIQEILSQVPASASPKDTVLTVANKYVGAGPDSKAAYFYLAAVTGAYELLGGEASDPVQRGRFCVAFDRFSAEYEITEPDAGNLKGSAVDLSRLSLDPSAGIVVTFWNGEENFGDFSHTLTESRKTRLRELATRLNIEPGLVNLQELGTRERVDCVGVNEHRSYAVFLYTKPAAGH